LISLFLSPADFAWLRAFAMIASNSDMDGGGYCLEDNHIIFANNDKLHSGMQIKPFADFLRDNDLAF
jgi:hypothetical protein